MTYCNDVQTKKGVDQSLRRVNRNCRHDEGFGVFLCSGTAYVESRNLWDRDEREMKRGLQ